MRNTTLRRLLKAHVTSNVCRQVSLRVSAPDEHPMYNGPSTLQGVDEEVPEN